MKPRSHLLTGTRQPRRPKRAGPVRRMPPAERRAMILARASEFFAEYGLTAQTRALAKACGVAQRLLYRYFPSKSALVGEVYETAIVAPFKAVWLLQLRDRTQPLQTRLDRFYSEYFDAVLTRKWLRLFLYASLAEAKMAPDYIQAIVFETLETIVIETARDHNVPLPRRRELIHEIGWVLHGAVSHLAIRRQVYRAARTIPESDVLRLHVRAFLTAFPALVAEARAIEGVPMNGRRSLRSA